jgi:hypothetical protein
MRSYFLSRLFTRDKLWKVFIERGTEPLDLNILGSGLID